MAAFSVTTGVLGPRGWYLPANTTGGNILNNTLPPNECPITIIALREGPSCVACAIARSSSRRLPQRRHSGSDEELLPVRARRLAGALPQKPLLRTAPSKAWRLTPLLHLGLKTVETKTCVPRKKLVTGPLLNHIGTGLPLRRDAMPLSAAAAGRARNRRPRARRRVGAHQTLDFPTAPCFSA